MLCQKDPARETPLFLQPELPVAALDKLLVCNDQV